MNIVNAYEEYLKRKTSCEDVVSWAEVFERTVCKHANKFDEMLVLLPSDSFVDYYHYSNSRKESYILKSWKNGLQSDLLSALETQLLSKKAIRQWLDYVFYQDESGIHYDKYYDGFRVAEGSDLTFGALMSGIEREWLELHLPAVKHVFLPAKLTNLKPLIYLLKSLHDIEVHTIPVLSTDPKSSWGGRYTEGKNNFVLMAGGGIPLDSLFDCSLMIQVPDDAQTLETFALPGIKWGDITNGLNDRYSLGGVDFIETGLSADDDIFGNVFLNVFDFDQQKKCLKVL